MTISGANTIQAILPTMDDRLQKCNELKSSGRLKQENHNEQMLNFVQV